MITISIITLIVLLSSAVLGIQIGYDSSLAQSIKKYLGLADPSKLNILSKPLFWYKLIPKQWFFILTPFILVISYLIKIWEFISNLVECEKCTSVWIGFGLLMLTQHDLLTSLIVAPITIMFVMFLNKIN